MFNPYRKWLGIPEDEQPPTHYRLLGIASDERDLDVINAAVVRQSAYVRNFQSGKYADDASRILTEIAAAKSCLLDNAKRSEYDADLRRQAAPPAPEEDLDLAPDPAFEKPKAGIRPAVAGQATTSGQAINITQAATSGKPEPQPNPGKQPNPGQNAGVPAVRPAGPPTQGQRGRMVPAPRPGQQPLRRSGPIQRGSPGPMDPLLNPGTPVRVPRRQRTQAYSMSHRGPSSLSRYWKPLIAGLSLGPIALAVIFWNLGDDTGPIVASTTNGSANGQNTTGPLTNNGAMGNGPTGNSGATSLKDATKNTSGSNSSGVKPWNSSGGNSANPSMNSNGGSTNTGAGNSGASNTSGSNGGGSSSSPSSNSTPSNSNNGGGGKSARPEPARANDPPNDAVEVANPDKRTSADWSNNEEGWAEALRLGLSFGGRGPGFVTFAPSGSPFAAVGESVWNLEENVEVGRFRISHDDFDVAAVNQNGQIVAVNESFFNDGIIVYGVGEPLSLGSLDNADRARRLRDDLARRGHEWMKSPYRDARVTYLQFAGPSTLVAAYTKSPECRIVEYDLATKEPLGDFPCEPFDGRYATLDPDGVYMAFAGKSSIRIIDLQKRKSVSSLRPPKREAKEGAPKSSSEFTCQGLAFSPDSQMLAALVQGGTRLVVWNGKSELLIDQDLDLKFSPTYVGPRLVWIPDGAGWILHGQYLMDRETRTVLWELKSQSADPFSDLRFVNQEHVVVQRAEVGGRTLSRVPVPWVKMAGALKALRRKEPAYVAPGVSIGLSVTADQLRVTDKSKVDSEIERIVGNRLRDSQIPIRRAETGVVIKATYVESEGEPVRSGLKAGSPTVRGDLTLELVAAGVDAPLWKAVLAAEAPLDALRKPTSETLTIFDLLAGQLKGESFPRYIPKDRTLANLPIVSEF